MKRFVALSLAVAPYLQADLTLEQKIEGGAQSGQIVMRVKGGKFRLDLPGGQAGSVSTIVDVKSGDTITLFHEKRIAITRTGVQVRQAQETKAKQAGVDLSKNVDPPKPRATNQKERIGEYDAEVYTMSVDDSTETLWIVKNYPKFPAIKEDLLHVSEASTGGAYRAGTLDVATLPGMVVKRQKERGGQKMTITLTSVSQDSIENSFFEPPANYKTVLPSEPAAPN